MVEKLHVIKEKDTSVSELKKVLYFIYLFFFKLVIFQGEISNIFREIPKPKFLLTIRTMVFINRF